MSSWAERVHRRAADLGSVVTSCGHPGSSGTPYPPYRLEKVKFGVPLEEVCKNDNIPGPLLVLILKLNKESPNRRDVFRAPGHQGAMKKLIHFLQAGRLVNVDNYSVYTIASVLKKFLRKIPNGVFGRLGENELFACIELDNETEQQERIHRLITSLPKYTQHLLVLLFGTFRVIATNASHAGTGMTSEALGVSVAPSFFQSCVSDGKTARMEDVLKFKVATKIMKHIIDKFAVHDLFGRDNYEYYARVTGRILKVQDEWICSFQYPPPPRGKLAQQKYALQHSLEAEKTWLQCQCERWGLIAQEESRSTPALLTSSSSALDNSALSLGVTPDHSFIESCARLSVSLEGPGLFAMATTSSPIPSPSSKPTDGDGDGDAHDGDYEEEEDIDENNPSNQMIVRPQQRRKKKGLSGMVKGRKDDDENEDDECRPSSHKQVAKGATCSRCNRGIKHSSSCSSTRSSKSTNSGGGGNGSSQPQHHMTLDELRAVNRYAESTKSLSYLPQMSHEIVHERQTARMRTRSEWFLGAAGLSNTCSNCLAAQRADEFMGGSSNDIPLEPSNEMYMMFKRRINASHQRQHAEHMDTDDGEDYCSSSGGQYLSPHGPGTGLGCRTDANSSSTSAARVFLDANFSTHSAGNIRLSNSAESVQYPVTRRPSRRGLTAMARHHPHRSSLRRNKDKVKSSAGNGNGNLCCTGCCNSTRNSIAECAPTTNFSSRPRTVSFDTNSQLKSFIAAASSSSTNMDVDTAEPLLKSDATIYIYTSPPDDEDIDEASTTTGSTPQVIATTAPTGLRFKPPRV